MVPYAPQQAGRHARRHLLPHQRQHRQAAPQRVAARGVGVAARRVEEEVAEPPAADVLVLGRHVREEQPRRREPALFGFGADVVLGRRRETEEPEDAARDAAQDSGPDVEDGGVDLVGLVEVAEDERLLWDPVLRARGRGRRGRGRGRGREWRSRGAPFVRKDFSGRVAVVLGGECVNTADGVSCVSVHEVGCVCTYTKKHTHARAHVHSRSRSGACR